MVGVSLKTDVLVAVEVDVVVLVRVEIGVDVVVRVDVIVCVGVGVSGKVGVADRMITVDVGDGMNGGVGERIAGKGEGVEIGVIIGRGMTCPLHATRNKLSTVTDRIFPIFILDPLLPAPPERLELSTTGFEVHYSIH